MTPRWVTAPVLLALTLSSLSVPAYADSGSGTVPAPAPTAGPGADTPDPSPGPVAVALAQAASSGQAVVVPSLTTETHQLLANPDGSLSSVDSPLPVRVQQNGTWVPVSAALNQNSDGTYSPAATPSGLDLSGGGAGPLVTMTDPDGQQLSYSLPFTLPEPTVTGSTALYSSVLPGVDLSVSVTDQGGFSDVLIVHSATAAANPDLAKLTLAAATQGLVLSTDAEGDLDATASDGTVAFTAPQPVMWDSSAASANGATSDAVRSSTRTALAETKQDAGDGAGTDDTVSGPSGPGTGAQVDPVGVSISSGTLTLTPDQSLLTGSSTNYPVYIDPYTNPSSGSSGNYDELYSSSECSGTPQFNVAQTNGEGVGYQGTGDACGTGLERSFYTLPISGMPSTAIVNSSVVTAPDTYAASWNCSQDQTVYLHTGIGTLGSGTDWNNQPSTNDANYAVAQATVASGSNSNSSCSNKDATFTVTTQVQKLVKAGLTSWLVGLFGVESPQSSSNVDFLRFSTKITITTNFDVPPNVPTPSTYPESANPTGPSCNDATAGWIGAAGANGVQFNAALATEMNGENLEGNFDILDYNSKNSSGEATSVNNASVGWVSPGHSVSTKVTGLIDGHTYDWGVQAQDDNVKPEKSDWITSCRFVYDDTPPTTPAVAQNDPNFPPLGGGTVSTGFAGATSTLNLTVTATDPLPAPTCTLNSNAADACQASGIDHFIWSMDSQPTTTDYQGSTAAANPDPDSTNPPTGQASISVPVANWGVHNLYIAAVDKAGNASQVPTSYTFYAPWNPATKIAPGDISGDGVPDLLATTQTGDLDLISGDAGPNTPPTLVSPAADTPTGANSPSKGSGTWNDYWLAHRGSLTGGAVDDLYAYDHATHDMYTVKNDLDAGGNGKAGFTMGRFTDFANNKPSCNSLTPASRCSTAVDYDGTDWNNVTQITAPGDVYNQGFGDLITIENGQLWLYKGVSGPALSTPVLLGDGDWSNFTLISPGTVSGSPTLWVRDKTSGNVYSFNIAPSATTGLPPLLNEPNATVTPLVSGIAATGGGTLCLAEPAANAPDGTDMTTTACQANQAQQTFALAADGTVHVLGKCLDVYHSGTANDTPVDLYTCNGSGAQTWTEAANGSLVNPESGLCLSDPASNPAPGTAVVLSTCDNGSEQNWNSGSTAALPAAPAATPIINLPTSAYPNSASPGDVNGPISTTDPTGAPDGNPDFYAVDASGQLIEYPGGPANNGMPTFASPVSLGTVTNTAAHAWTLADGSGTTAHDGLDTTSTPDPGLDASLTGGATWNTDTTLTKADPTLTAGTNLQLDGTTGYATTTPTTANPTGTAVNTTADYTVSVWAKLNSFASGNYYTVVAQRDSTGVRSGFYLQYSGAYQGWALVIPGTDAASATAYYHASGVTPVVNQWYHLVATYQAATGAMSLYVNGNLVSTATDTGTPWAATGPLLIGGADGGNTPGSTADFPGQIADLHIYNTALPAADAAALGDTTPITKLN